MDGAVAEEDTTRKIVLELDYTHFVKPKGWMNITQIVSCPIVDTFDKDFSRLKLVL